MKMRKLCAILAFCALGAIPAAVWGQTAGAQDRPRGETRQSEGLQEELFRQSVMLGVPEAELSALVRSCQGAGFTAEEIARLLALMTRAKLEGMPHDDLLNKLREGLAKDASPEAIQTALQTKARLLHKAKDVVDTLLLEGWLARDYGFAVKVVADALDAGATAADILCSVRDSRPCGPGIPDVRVAFESGKAAR